MYNKRFGRHSLLIGWLKKKLQIDIARRLSRMSTFLLSLITCQMCERLQQAAAAAVARTSKKRQLGNPSIH
jgi:hypothetical protein